MVRTVEFEKQSALERYKGRGGESRVEWLRAACLAMAAVALVVTSWACWLLLTEHWQTQRTAEQDLKYVNWLIEKAREDSSWKPALEAEYQRQKLLSFQRDLFYKRWGLTALTAAVVFVCCVKLYLANQRTIPTLEEIQREKETEKSRRRFWASRLFGQTARTKTERPTDRRAQKKADFEPGRVDEDEQDLSVVDRIVEEVGRTPDAAIPILQRIQQHFRYLPEPALRRVCELTEITPSQIVGVASFYAQFRRTPIGKHLIRVCHGTACHVAGAREITKELRRHLEIPDGADTDVDRMFTVEEVACLGCCSLAPVMMIDEVTAGKLTPAKACEAVDEFLAERV